MKSYKYRGWLNLAFSLFGVLVTILGLIFWEELTFGCFFMVSIPQFILYVGQRKLTEQQWRKQQNENDERMKIVTAKAGAITAIVSESLTGIALLWMAFQENEAFTPAMYILAGIFIVSGFTFSVAQMILNKKT